MDLRPAFDYDDVLDRLIELRFETRNGCSETAGSEITQLEREIYTHLGIRPPNARSG